MRASRRVREEPAKEAPMKSIVLYLLGVPSGIIILLNIFHVL